MNESTPDTALPAKQPSDRIPAKRPKPLAGMRLNPETNKPEPVPGQSHLARVLPEQLGKFCRTISADERRRRQMERASKLPASMREPVVDVPRERRPRISKRTRKHAARKAPKSAKAAV